MEYKFKDLVLKCKNGDTEAKKEMLEKLKPLVMSSIRKYYFGNDNFEDVLQDGYLAVLEGLEDFDESREVPFLGYIRSKLRFFYMDNGRKSKKNEWISLDQPVEDPEGNVALIDLLADTESDVEEIIEQKETARRIQLVLDTLTEKQRRIIKLHYEEGLSMKKISECLGVHYQTVFKTKTAAMKKIRKNIC
jgi:RNA polymerase sporulation-specific sigma factor